MRFPRRWLLLVGFLLGTLPPPAPAVELRGTIVDSVTGQPLAARLYIQSAADRWHFARTASDQGSAIEYRKQRGPASVEMHTTLSAHPFVADLPPGQYTLTVERGKEYLPATQTIRLTDHDQRAVIELQRWIDMGRQGWYSGDTHVHREIDELPNLMQAEDLNVALPLTYWVTRSHTPPSQGDKNTGDVPGELIRVDPLHVIYPLNTEYEIFSVRGTRHTLGAFFALNHKSVLKWGVPPVRPIAEQVHLEGGLLELDKHNWPWSMMLVPVMQVDLYELTNNHLWKTAFAFREFGEPPAEYMGIERDEHGWTEFGWIQFTLQNYYTLLNCGYRLRPTAGTASGVHPVPLGFGRVYVHLPAGFSYDAWIDGLNRGHSFVTTGPMLNIHFNGEPSGTVLKSDRPDNDLRITGWVRSARPVTSIEVIVSGQTRRTLAPANRPIAGGGYESRLDERLQMNGSGWLAVRCFRREPDGRVRFAHTAPFHVEVEHAPLRPRREEVDYLVKRVRDQITRNRAILSEEALQEYRQALEAYERLPTADHE